MASLDQIELLRKIDTEGMRDVLAEFPLRVESAFAQPLPPFNFTADKIRSIAIVGMGGSAIGGDLAQAALIDRVCLPSAVLRGATLPAWVGEDTLVIAVSYSGNTLETLTAYEEAKRRQCLVVAVSHGGALAERASQDGIPCVALHEYPQPRLAGGVLTAAMMQILAWADGISLEPTCMEIVKLLTTQQPQLIPARPTQDNYAKHLAYKLFDRLPVVVGVGVCAPVARRWKTQINENAKTICVKETFPELLHNTIEGLKNPLRIADDSVWLLLDSPQDRAVPAGQYHAFAELLERTGIAVERVVAPAGDIIAQQWWLMYLGDWVSYYLACLNDINPMPVPTIQAFKKNT